MNIYYIILIEAISIAAMIGIAKAMEGTSRYEGFPYMLNSGAGAEGCLLAIPLAFSTLSSLIFGIWLIVAFCAYVGWVWSVITLICIILGIIGSIMISNHRRESKAGECNNCPHYASRHRLPNVEGGARPCGALFCHCYNLNARG